MELSIKNFRSIHEKKYIFPKGNTLISGESGSGKSSILESIIWCFYGGSNVTPFGSKKIVTKVEIKLDNLIITRTKPPDKCQVIIGEDKKLEHDEAQMYLNNLFGSKGLWEISSYLKQDSRSGLLFNSSQEKFSLIKEIIFGREDNQNSPDVYLDKLSKFSKQLNSKIENCRGKIEILSETITENKNRLDSYEDLKKEEKRLLKLVTKYESIKEGIDKIKIQLSVAETVKENHNKLMDINQKLKLYPVLTIDTIEKWKTWIQASRQLSILDTSFERIDYADTAEELNSEIRIMERQYQQFKKNSDKCKNLNVDYDEDSGLIKIEETEREIKKIQNYANYLNIMKNIEKINHAIEKSKSQLKNLEEKEDPYLKGFKLILSKLDISDGNFCEDKVSECRDKISGILTDYLKCPHCNKNTVIENGELVIKKCKFMTKLELEKIKKNLKNIIIFYERKEKVQSEIENYLSMKQEMDIPEKVEEVKGDISIMKKYIQSLNSIDFIDYDTEEFMTKKDILEKLKHQEKVELLEQKIENFYDPIFEEYEAPKNFSSYYEEYRKLISEKELLEDYLEKNSEGNKEDLRKKMDKLSEMMIKLDDFKIYQDIKEKEKNLGSLQENHNEIVKKLEKCHSLKKIIEEESSVTLENMILNFNDILNEIVGEIFEDITIELGMFKKMKARGELKPQFNMKVLLKGNEYDNLHFLSGGEKDRISIALALTLSSLLNTPIIMFDESMSSLDEEMRERCLELIKKYASDKILINICHSTVEGYYDNIIRK
tara:strand:- start:37970 stop:40288 length:2319 start_codon:yes stop_codon:yes gene_type:complete